MTTQRGRDLDFMAQAHEIWIHAGDLTFEEPLDLSRVVDTTVVENVLE
jgi:hypothetical protein